MGKFESIEIPIRIPIQDTNLVRVMRQFPVGNGCFSGEGVVLGIARFLIFAFGWFSVSIVDAVSPVPVPQNSVYDVAILPQSCKKAYKSGDDFLAFFQATAREMAGVRGGGNPIVSDLFTVIALREKFELRYSQRKSENPIDQLIAAQLCQFSQYSEGADAPKDAIPPVVTSADPDLHLHLQQIAPRLVQDTKHIFQVNLVRDMNREKRRQWVESRRGEVKQAEQSGRKRAQEILNAL